MLTSFYDIPERFYGNWRCPKSRGKRHVSFARRVTPLEKGEIGRPDRFVRPVWVVTTGQPVFTDGSD
jgi:hypothetical protein